MSSRAVLAFEAALYRAAPHTSPVLTKSLAAATFDRLLKARAPRKPKAPANAAPETLGSGDSGRGPTSFEGMHPHLVHGGKYKVVQYPGQKPTTIGEGHSDWDHPDFAGHEVRTGHNPFEPLSRLGHKLEQHIQTLPPEERQSALKNYEHPSNPYHLAYISKLIKQTLDPNSPHFQDHEKSGKIGNLTENIPGARWAVHNADKLSTELPKTHHEDLTRLKTSDSKSAATFAAKNVTRAVRAASTVASLNRYMEAARKFGLDADTDPQEFTAQAQTLHLHKFSARRAPKGMLPEHLTGDHNTSVTHDFHVSGKKKGQPKFTAGAEFQIPAGEKSHWEDSLGAEGAAKINNHFDLVEHYKTLPVGEGSHPDLKGKTPGIDYLPQRAHDVLGAHDRAFRITKPAPSAS